ncbi:putative Histone-lysine N-methyltransferase EHMT1 [Hypsibius exemplaris]|uniref:Histone-lysine N-methyltransferase EHMT1 n=1 Tax=Hypsibius exemplaris TaxID=2072580 RepID=A0A1W0X9I0_HYPEX|nr:putative Histone-lysine N-methyltransferase EHMT1 [Hypsibius exemplaris]
MTDRPREKRLDIDRSHSGGNLPAVRNPTGHRPALSPAPDGARSTSSTHRNSTHGSGSRSDYRASNRRPPSDQHCSRSPDYRNARHKRRPSRSPPRRFTAGRPQSRYHQNRSRQYERHNDERQFDRMYERFQRRREDSSASSSSSGLFIPRATRDRRSPSHYSSRSRDDHRYKRRTINSDDQQSPFESDADDEKSMLNIPTGKPKFTAKQSHRTTSPCYPSRRSGRYSAHDSSPSRRHRRRDSRERHRHEHTPTRRKGSHSSHDNIRQASASAPQSLLLSSGVTEPSLDRNESRIHSGELGASRRREQSETELVTAPVVRRHSVTDVESVLRQSESVLRQSAAPATVDASEKHSQPASSISLDEGGSWVVRDITAAFRKNITQAAVEREMAICVHNRRRLWSHGRRSCLQLYRFHENMAQFDAPLPAEETSLGGSENTLNSPLTATPYGTDLIRALNSTRPSSPALSEDLSENLDTSRASSTRTNSSSTTAVDVPNRERGVSASPFNRSVTTPTAMTPDSGIDSRGSSVRDTSSSTASVSENDTQLLEHQVAVAGKPSTSSGMTDHGCVSAALRSTRNAKRPLSETVDRTPTKGPVSAAQNARMLEQQLAVLNVWRDTTRGVAGTGVQQKTSAKERSKRGSKDHSLFMDEVMVLPDSPNAILLRDRSQLLSSSASVSADREIASLHESSQSMASLEVSCKKMSAVDVVEMDIMAKKHRKVELLVPDYKHQEPKRFVGMFHGKIVAECNKLCGVMNKAEKKRTIPPFGKVSQCDVINVLRNIQTAADLTDPLLVQVAMYAAAAHRKQDSLLTIILLLIANGFDCNTKNDAGDSMLKMAFFTGDMCLIDVMLNAADLEDLDDAGNSALHVAVLKWLADRTCWNIVIMVLSLPHKNASLLFAKNKEMRSPLALCLAEPDFTKNHLEQFILAFGPAAIEAEKSDCLIHLLATFRRVDLLTFAISHYTFPPDRLDSEKRTFLHILAASATLGRDDVEALGELTRVVKASVDIKDKKGRTALDIARASGNLELVKELTDRASGPIDKQGLVLKDLAQGKEPFPIRVVNDRSSQRMEDFVYVRQNIYLGDGPKTKGSMSCGCRLGMCSTTTCVCLKRGLGYSSTGTIVPGTCKGNPIFECGSQCACGPNCSSRVVNGEFEVFMTAKRGWGLRTSRTVQPGEFICEFVGEVVESDRLLHRDQNNDWAMELTVDNYDGTMFHVDPTVCGNVARFLNHSCDPNLFPVRVYQSGDAPDTGVVMAMFSAQVIQKDRELTFHYGDAYWERQMERGIYCNCGSSKCKFKAKTSKKRKAAC